MGSRLNRSFVEKQINLKLNKTNVNLSVITAVNATLKPYHEKQFNKRILHSLQNNPVLKKYVMAFELDEVRSNYTGELCVWGGAKEQFIEYGDRLYIKLYGKRSTGKLLFSYPVTNGHLTTREDELSYRKEQLQELLSNLKAIEKEYNQIIWKMNGLEEMITKSKEIHDVLKLFPILNGG